MSLHASRGESGASLARFHALDALRGIAMALGIVLHGAVAYMAQPPADLLWPAMDRSRSLLADALFWWIHSFRIPLFFVIAGFFAMRLHESRGWRGFAANRLRRVGLPFALACIVILPLTFYVWSAGWLVTGRCTVDEVLAWKFADPSIQQNFKGPAHLWFLEYLLIISIGFLVVRGAIDRARGKQATPMGGAYPTTTMARWSRWFDQAISFPLRWLIFALPTAAILALDPEVFTGFRNSFVPSLSGLLYSSMFFAGGCALWTSRDRMAGRCAGAWLLVMATLPLTALVLVLMQQSNAGLGQRVTLGSAVSLAAWLGALGWLGVFQRVFSAESRVLRFISDSSYWVYLIHLPIVGLVQVAMLDSRLPAWLKLAVVVVAATAITLASYRWLVRGSIIGRLLGVPGPPKSENQPAPDSLVPAPVSLT